MPTPLEQQKFNGKERIELHFNTLPPTERVNLLAEQIADIASDLTPQQVQTIKDALAGIKPHITEILDFLQPQIIYARRDELLGRYKVTLLDSSKVAFALPVGSNRIDFLNEVQSLSIALHQMEPWKYKAERAVLPVLLQHWQRYTGFLQTVDQERLLRIDGNVKESTCYSREELENKGWNNVTLQDLAVAHAATYLLNGKDLFEGKTVRCEHNIMSFRLGGLQTDTGFFDADRTSFISASHVLLETN